MSAILGVFHLDGRPASVECAPPMLARMQRRGTEVRALHVDGEALLGVSRYEWECVPKLAGAAAVARRGHLTAVADASLYYLDDLVRRIGSAADGVDRDRPAELILAAYEKWGERCVEYLEGDYACIVWDAKERRGWCTRDWTGSRPLFYACRENTVVVASTIGGVLAHPVVRDELNVLAIALEAAALPLSTGFETVFGDITPIAAGSALSFRRASAVCQSAVWWNPEVRPVRTSKSFDDAAETLRSLLSDAVVERLGPQPETTVWLSGGRDSTAVFAAGEHAIASRLINRRLHPISLRLDADDPQNEDHFIDATAARWGRETSSLSISSLGRFVRQSGWDDLDEPPCHAFEQLLRCLSRRSRSAGCSVALTGNGGDSLFFVSGVVNADLLRAGRLVALLREWRRYRVRHDRMRQFVHWAVAPILPEFAHRAIEALRGRHLHGYLERPLPTWLRPEFLRQYPIAARAREGTPRATKGSRAAFELWWYLTTPFFSRIHTVANEFALEEGVEVRAPILDTRVARFAAEGPWTERRQGSESKLLIRHAMRGLLPGEVLAPRLRKTGTLRTYMGSSLSQLAPSIREAFRASILDSLGIIDKRALLTTAEQILPRHPIGVGAEQLFYAYRVEKWLAARYGSRSPSIARRRLNPQAARNDQDPAAAVVAVASGTFPTRAAKEVNWSIKRPSWNATGLFGC